jgi:hypothetical protein
LDAVSSQGHELNVVRIDFARNLRHAGVLSSFRCPDAEFLAAFDVNGVAAMQVLGGAFRAAAEDVNLEPVRFFDAFAGDSVTAACGVGGQ